MQALVDTVVQRSDLSSLSSMYAMKMPPMVTSLMIMSTHALFLAWPRTHTEEQNIFLHPSKHTSSRPDADSFLPPF